MMLDLTSPRVVPCAPSASPHCVLRVRALRCRGASARPLSCRLAVQEFSTDTQDNNNDVSYRVRSYHHPKTDVHFDALSFPNWTEANTVHSEQLIKRVAGLAPAGPPGGRAGEHKMVTYVLLIFMSPPLLIFLTRAVSCKISTFRNGNTITNGLFTENNSCSYRTHIMFLNPFL